MSNNEAPEKPDIWLACAEANKDDLRECAVHLEGGWKCDEDWHYVPVERIAELEGANTYAAERIKELAAERDALKEKCNEQAKMLALYHGDGVDMRQDHE